MKKLKNLWEKYERNIVGIFSIVFTGIIAFISYTKGFQRSNKIRKKAEIDSLKSKKREMIIKEKLEDSKKDIHEISSEVDDILNN